MKPFVFGVFVWIIAACVYVWIQPTALECERYEAYAHLNAHPNQLCVTPFDLSLPHKHLESIRTYCRIKLAE
jgi:hypothetical protein